MNTLKLSARATLFLLSAFCLLPPTTAQNAPLTPLKIATLSPLSGPLAQTGEQLKQGAQLALEAAKPAFARLGFALELSPQDDQASADVGGAAARRLLSDSSVLAVVGAVNSSVVLVASSIFADDKLSLLVPAATANAITERGLTNVFRIGARDSQQGAAAGKFILEKLKSKKVYLINDKTAYGAGLTLEVSKALEGKTTVIANEGTEEKLEFSSLIIKIKALEPDLIYFGGTYPQVGTFLKQLRSSGVSTQVMGGHGLDSSGLAQIAGNAAQGVVFTTVAAPVGEIPQAQSFFSVYKTAYGKEADGYGLLAYEAMRTALEGIKKSIVTKGERPTRAAVTKAISSATVNGLSGKIQFDSRGDRVKPRIFVLELNEKFQKVKLGIFTP